MSAVTQLYTLSETKKTLSTYIKDMLQMLSEKDLILLEINTEIEISGKRLGPEGVGVDHRSSLVNVSIKVKDRVTGVVLSL